ncbi:MULTISPECIES: TetR/AcrR family transcriptional regulator [unclassified Amycolatopsis]|uniref:TetR/AcrR family transcriptional regulator n=1 Tax=unclassified Amycolatopsis TaxID=2618356 RepID=UPI001C6A4137|nr:TetR/AcrR family transcriptional regulator [Amycolatopsis sp. DSM 110486]QYN22001.1 TetR/AcrR family transcriptional regulator [Amycolatopsis sp. DSM 110486]
MPSTSAHATDGAVQASARGERAEKALVDAVLDLIDESGVTGLTIDNIARRAKVGKPTIYRRWSNKEELVAYALGHVEVPPVIDPDGELRSTLIAVLANLSERLTSTRVGRAWCRLIGSDDRYSEATRLYAEEFIAPRIDALVRLLQREIDAGTLRADIDALSTVNMMISTVVGGVVNVQPSGHVVPPVDAIVDTFLTGLSRRSPT